MDNSLRKCIILAYPNGYQIWDITSLENVFEVYSARGLKCINMIKVLHAPPPGIEEKEALFYNARPAIVIVQDGDQPNTSQLRFVSLKDAKEQCAPMSIPRKILTVECSKHAICVVTKDRIHLLSPITLTVMNVSGNQNYLKCFPNSPIALGTRWLAYATLESSQVFVDELIPTMKVAKDGIRAAKDLIQSGVSSMMSMYLGNEETPAPLQAETEQERREAAAAGTVAIYDIVDETIVLRIKCHKEPISHLAFDDSGTLLCTAPESGNSLNVIKLSTTVQRVNGKKETKVTGTLLYQLYRGFTNATITQINFTSDSKWVAVCTANGTTHLFPINPDGKPVTTRTHTPLGEKISSSFALDDDKITLETQFVEALDRIKFSHDGDSGAFACTFVLGRTRKLLLLNPRGSLVQYQLQPLRTVDAENRAVLKLEVIPEQEWDVNRKLNMLEVQSDFSSSAALTNRHFSPSKSENWASYSENETFDTKFLEDQKVMITKRVLFHFQTYDDAGTEDLAESVLMFHPRAQTSQQFHSPVAPFAHGGSRISTGPSAERSSPSNAVQGLKAAIGTKLQKKNSPKVDSSVRQSPVPMNIRNQPQMNRIEEPQAFNRVSQPQINRQPEVRAAPIDDDNDDDEDLFQRVIPSQRNQINPNDDDVFN